MKQGRKPTRDEKILLSKANLEWTEYQTLSNNQTTVDFISKKDKTVITLTVSKKPKIVTAEETN